MTNDSCSQPAGSSIGAAAGKKQQLLPFLLKGVDFMCMAVHEANERGDKGSGGRRGDEGSR